MQNENGKLIIDILQILPVEVECFISAPSIEDPVILGMLEPTELEYFKKVEITSRNASQFIDRINTKSIEVYFNRIEIRVGSQLLFEGYDGVEFGVLSRDVAVPGWFYSKHIITGNCEVAFDW